MLNSIILFILMVSPCDAVYPNGTYTRQIEDPYLFVDCTFHEPPRASVYMEIKCNPAMYPSGAVVDIEEVPDSMGLAYRVKLDEEELNEMIRMTDDLNTRCPGRNFTYGDFSVFTELVPEITYSTSGGGVTVVLNKS